MSDQLTIQKRKEQLRDMVFSGKYNTKQLRSWYEQEHDIRSVAVFYADLNEILLEFKETGKINNEKLLEEKKDELEQLVYEVLKYSNDDKKGANALRAIQMLGAMRGVDVFSDANAVLQFGNFKLRIAGTSENINEPSEE